MILSLAFLLAPVNSMTIQEVDRPLTGSNSYYVGNRAPLAPSAFRKLPITSVTPKGWVRKQLQLEADGFIGHLTEISPWLNKKNNAWLSPKGEGDHGWEEVPYWLKGFGDLGYVLGDQRIVDEAQIWIDGAIAGQREDGYFGPRANLLSNKGEPDVWPNMVMLNALQTYCEFTEDTRVIELMTKYFKWELARPDEAFLLSYWERQRGGDNIASIYWLYNRTGDKWLLELVEKIHRRTANWVGGVPDWHGVNFAQAFREPAEYWALSKKPEHLSATEADYQKMRTLYGEVPGGMYGADENARPGFGDPRQAAETCAMVEMMLSDEELLSLTGNPVWAERCEDVAFNSLPASMTPDEKALHYLTSPNMVLIDGKSKAPGLQNSGPMQLFDPNDHRCCQHNVSHGWPYYAEHLWLATNQNGLGVALYAPSKVTAKVGPKGQTVTIREETNYPFEEKVNFRFETINPVRFPLTLRLPAWCASPKVLLNGKPVSLPTVRRSYLVIDRSWGQGDQLELQLPMQVSVRKWPANHNAVSVDRGPLTYSLKIGEKYVKNGGTKAWPAFEVHSTTPWNFGLPADADFEVKTKSFPKSQQPFTPDAVPVELVTKARRIPEWQSDHLGLVGLLQSSPARTAEALQTVTLVPMGATRLRIAQFPTVSTASSAMKWTVPPAPKKGLPAKASHVWSGDSTDALTDGLVPETSGDESIPRFTWWDHKGGEEWVEVTLPAAKSVSSTKVYWFDDRRIGGGCRVPDSWKLEAWVGGKWMPVSATGAFGVQKDRFNSVNFSPVVASRFRVVARLRDGYSGGILEWQLR